MTSASGIQDAELCGYIGVLQKRHPRTYRKTFMGSGAHAKWSDAPDKAERMFRLTDEERAEVNGWQAPVDFQDDSPLGHVTLRYADAHTEEPVGLDVNGCYMEVQQDPGPARYVEKPGLLVPATVDMWWVYDHPRGKTVFVGDIKTGEHAIASGARNLQFVAPALALADREGAGWYRTGIWYAREARWELGPAVHVTSALALQDLTRLQRAGTNPPAPVLGGHCTDCFQRAHCDAFNLPVTQIQTELAPMVRAGGLERASNDELAKAHLLLSSLRKIEDTATRSLKAEIARRSRDVGPIVLASGEVLSLRETAGREYADTAEARAAGLTLKRSKPSQVIHMGKP